MVTVLLATAIVAVLLGLLAAVFYAFVMVVRELGRNTERMVEVVSNEVGRTVQRAVQGVVEGLGEVLKPPKIEDTDAVQQQPQMEPMAPWEHWGEDPTDRDFPDPTDRNIPDPDIMRPTAVSVPPGFTPDVGGPAIPDLTAENLTAENL